MTSSSRYRRTRRNIPRKYPQRDTRRNWYSGDRTRSQNMYQRLHRQTLETFHSTIPPHLHWPQREPQGRSLSSRTTQTIYSPRTPRSISYITQHLCRLNGVSTSNYVLTKHISTDQKTTSKKGLSKPQMPVGLWKRD